MDQEEYESRLYQDRQDRAHQTMMENRMKPYQQHSQMPQPEQKPEKKKADPKLLLLEE